MMSSNGMGLRTMSAAVACGLLTLFAGPVLALVDHVETEQIVLAGDHPDQAELEAAFSQAAADFGVPAALLKAVAYVESRWVHTGPTIDYGYGIMHLVDNSDSQTLVEAAKASGYTIEQLKTDPVANIRGGAALIARYAAETVGQPSAVEDFEEALQRFSGLNAEVRTIQVRAYYKVLAEGASATNSLNMQIELPAVPIDMSLIEPEARGAGIESDDYGPAIWNPADPSNYSTSRGTIDRWVNHWIGSGTYAGAISWFKNPSSNVSAHFVVRQSDGQITQMVRIHHTAWHCGNWNSRSIGVEHEATPSNPWPQDASAPMLIASSTVCRHFCNVYGIPKTRSYIVGHQEVPGASTACPGNIPWDTYINLVQGTTTNNAQHVGNTIPTQIAPGECAVVSVSFKNTGGTTWSSGAAYKLGAVGDSDPFAAGRQNLTGDVGPNGTATFTFPFQAPTTPGVYTSDWRMIREGVEWFGDTLTVQVNVTSGGSVTIIVEARAGGQNTGWYSEEGTWGDSSGHSTATGCTAGIGSRYGSTYRSVAGLKKATFAPSFPAPGQYKVYTTWGNASNRRTPILHRIVHAGGTTDVNVDQTGAPDVWVELGTFNFGSGASGSVTISNDNIDASGSMYADAVRFVQVDTTPPPPAGGVDANGWVRDWVVLGPFNGDNLNDAIAGGCGVSDRNIEPSPGQGTGTGAWKRVTGTSFNSGYGVNFDAVLNCGDVVNGYAHTYVFNPAARTVRVRVGSDDSFEVFVDGIERARFDGPRGSAPDQTISSPFTLSQGWHRVMLHVADGGGGWNGMLRFDDGGSNVLTDITATAYRDDMAADEGLELPADVGARPAVIRDWLILGSASEGALDASGCQDDCINDVDILAANGGGAQGMAAPTKGTVQAGKTWASLRDSAAANLTSPGILDLTAYYGTDTNKVAYLHTWCRNLGSPVQARIALASDDAGQVWVNGVRVLQDCTCHGSTCDAAVSTPFTLQSGDNRILVRIDQGTGGWGGTVRLIEAASTNPVGGVLFKLDGVAAPPPEITGQPVSVSVCPGENASFSVQATGEGTLSYQWQRDSANLADGGSISGANTSTLNITGVQPSDAGDYVCIVSNLSAGAASDAATLAVETVAFAQQPQAQNVAMGGNAVFNVVATARAPISYQWQKGVVDLVDDLKFSGTQSASLTVGEVQLGDMGEYRCVVTGGCGDEATSDGAELTIDGLPGSIPGDFDHDYDVDMTDYSLLQNCLNGSGGGIIGAACAPTDIDDDGDVDGMDVQLFAGCLSGEGILADANCVQP